MIKNSLCIPSEINQTKFNLCEGQKNGLEAELRQGQVVFSSIWECQENTTGESFMSRGFFCSNAACVVKRLQSMKCGLAGLTDKLFLSGTLPDAY